MRTRPGSGSQWRSTGIASGALLAFERLCRSTRIASPPPAARRGAIAAGQAVGRLVGVTLDSHHRKNDHTGRLGIGIHITATAERSLALWKLHDDSHAPPPPTAEGTDLPRPAVGS